MYKIFEGRNTRDTISQIPPKASFMIAKGGCRKRPSVQMNGHGKYGICLQYSMI